MDQAAQPCYVTCLGATMSGAGLGAGLGSSMNFASDNVTGAAPEVLAALAEAAAGSAAPYGEDEITARVEARFAELFETDVAVFLVPTGTAANALALAQLSVPYGAVYCHENAHVFEHEAGAPGFYGAGQLIPLPGDHGRIAPGILDAAAAEAWPPVHYPKPAAVSISQSSEAGTIYSDAAISELAAVCGRHRMRLHMDGARFANALVAAGGTAAGLTWRAGVDVLSFGATKNGTFAAEAVVFFDPALGREFEYRRKRGGHLLSKMRFLACQMDAYLADGLWLRLAGHANAMAARMADGLAAVDGVALVHPVETNMVFARLPPAMAAGLADEGFIFHAHEAGPEVQARLVTAFDTGAEDVEALISAADRLAASR